jgi:hypothetical protein
VGTTLATNSIAFFLEKRAGFFFFIENVRMQIAIEQGLLRANQHVQDDPSGEGKAIHHPKIRDEVALFFGHGFATFGVDAGSLLPVVKDEDVGIIFFDTHAQLKQTLHIVSGQLASQLDENAISVNTRQMRTQWYRVNFNLLHRPRECHK